MADTAFEDPHLAALYDPLDPDRTDLDVYAALIDELGARSVLDVGCGTGTFACLLAARGLEVVGLDPAVASLDVARRKPSAGRVRWIQGEVRALPPLQMDAATMTGNVAQVFLDDEKWLEALRGVRAAIRPTGHLVFETRVPEDQAWLRWDRERAAARAHVPDIGSVESWPEVTSMTDKTVSFTTTFLFERDGSTVTSASTLRFRTIAEVRSSLEAADLRLAEVRDAPDRPGREHVFIAVRPD